MNKLVNSNINKLISNKINKRENNLESENSEDLEQELNLLCNKPKKYGISWNDEDKQHLIKMIKNYNNQEINILNDNIIKIMATKLERTDGGIKEEIKKIIFNSYIQGNSVDNISKEYNLTVSNVKLIINLFLENNSDKLIKLLEKENKLMKLKIENYKLRKELETLQ